MERAVEALGENTTLGFVYGGCRIVEGGHELLTWRPPRRFDVAALESGSWIPQPGSFLRRTTFERVGGLNESFELAMDVDLWLRLLESGRSSRRLDGLVSVFELHPTSKTGSTPRRSFHEENARAFLLAGRPRGAAISLGRAAATAAAESHGALDPHLASAHGPDGCGPALPARTITAAARAEAAVIELGSSLRGVRHLRARPSGSTRSSGVGSRPRCGGEALALPAGCSVSTGRSSPERFASADSSSASRSSRRRSPASAVPARARSLRRRSRRSGSTSSRSTASSSAAASRGGTRSPDGRAR